MENTAFHEIGHALINYKSFFGIINSKHLESISIIEKNGSRGRNSYSYQYFKFLENNDGVYKIIKPTIPLTSFDINLLKKECLIYIAGVVAQNIYVDLTFSHMLNIKDMYSTRENDFSNKTSESSGTLDDYCKFREFYKKLKILEPATPHIEAFAQDLWSQLEQFYQEEKIKTLLTECSIILDEEKEITGATLTNYFVLGELFIDTCEQTRDNLISDYENITITSIIEVLKEDEDFKTLITGKTDYFTIEKKVLEKLRNS